MLSSSCLASASCRMQGVESCVIPISHLGGVHAAVGPSIAADVRQADRAGAAQPESKLDVLTRAHGVSRDVAERYLMACDAKIGDTHKMLQASRVPLSSPFLCLLTCILKHFLHNDAPLPLPYRSQHLKETQAGQLTSIRGFSLVTDVLSDRLADAAARASCSFC